MNIPESEESMKDCEQASLNMNNNIKFSVWVSFFEIYNECVYDLFVPVLSKFQKRKILRLSQDVKGYSFIKGIVMSAFYLIVLKFLSNLCYIKLEIENFYIININIIKKSLCFGSVFWYVN